MRTWRCGDCRHEWPISVKYCRRPFDDYIALHGGSIESAIAGAVERATGPLVKAAELRLEMRAFWNSGYARAYRMRWVTRRAIDNARIAVEQAKAG